ncbi:MAG TPA: lytic transglycosylase, partial [Dyella sp.]|nr:lytic transglycosylase [Dyella sp.]
MSYRHAARSFRLVSLVAALMQLTACASGASATKPQPPSASLNALYGQLDQASRSYETALQQTRAGDAEGAQKTLDQALDQLKNSAAQCGTTPGCDPQRFFSVFDHLLRLKDGSFIGDETPDEDTGEPATTSLPGQSGGAINPAEV